MAQIEERAARLEGIVEEHSQMFIDFRAAIGHLEQRMDSRFLAVDARFLALENRLTGMETRFDAKFDKLGTDMTTNFRWTVGILLTGFAAIVAALVTR